jgi:hypothetical protein
MSSISSVTAPFTAGATHSIRPAPRDSSAERADQKSAPPAPPAAPESPVSSRRLDIRV